MGSPDSKGARVTEREREDVPAMEGSVSEYSGGGGMVSSWMGEGWCWCLFSRVGAGGASMREPLRSLVSAGMSVIINSVNWIQIIKW